MSEKNILADPAHWMFLAKKNGQVGGGVPSSSNFSHSVATTFKSPQSCSRQHESNVSHWYICGDWILNHHTRTQRKKNVLFNSFIYSRVIDGTSIWNFALLTVCVQIKFPVSSVVTRTTHQFRRVWEGFLMHSFLVGPQVTFRCRIISATSITNFDITIKAVLFLMCCPCVVFQFRFALEYLVTVVARDLHLSVDIPHV